MAASRFTKLYLGTTFLATKEHFLVKSLVLMYLPASGPFLRILPVEGPQKITAGRQLGLLQIRIALQEVCNIVVISQS